MTNNFGSIGAPTNLDATADGTVTALLDRIRTLLAAGGGGGGGTQYAEDSVQAAITGTAIMWEDSGDVMRPVNATKPLPTSVASLPLPSGAATSALQPGLGTAGTANANVLTVQGIASMTPVVVSVPTDPFGANADAAVSTDATGSISAKLRGAVKNSTTLNTNFGATTDAEQVGDGSLIAIMKRIRTLLAGTLTTTDAAIYTEGDVDASITGVPLLWEDSGNTLATTTAANPMPVRQVALSSVDLPLVAGTVAHDGVDAGNPVKIGGKAITANPTAVSALDRVDAMFDKAGRQIMRLGAVRDLCVTQTTTITSSTVETTFMTAGAAGVFHDLSILLITNTSATAITVTIKDATSGSTIASIGVPAGDTRGFTAPQAAMQTTAANNWTATCSASVASIVIFAQANKVV